MINDDEDRLAAFLDGQMDDADAAAFEARLASDPTLAARAEAWQANDRRIAAAFAPVADMPLPADVLAMLKASEPTLSAPAPTAANDNPPWWRRHAVPLGGALAASLAALVMLSPQPDAGGKKDLSYALETGRSLAAVQLADGTSVTPTMTVRAADGRFCREFQLGDTQGLACRKDGHWSVEAEAKGRGPAAESGIAVAGGADAGGLADAYTRIGASDPLGSEDETRLISKNWSAD